MQRIYRWMTEQGGGIEHLVLALGADAIDAHGVVIGPASDPLFGCSYTVRCDAGWRVREARVRVAGGAGLHLRSDGAGRWCDGTGTALPHLDGCIDIDLTCTPFTNTLPIRRLGEALRARQEILVAYIALPAATVAPSRQAYARQAPDRVRFESLSDPFEADIGVDADGLVLDYPGLFRRM